MENQIWTYGIILASYGQHMADIWSKYGEILQKAVPRRVGLCSSDAELSDSFKLSDWGAALHFTRFRDPLCVAFCGIDQAEP